MPRLNGFFLTNFDSGNQTVKLGFQSAMFSTAIRGHIIETMFARLKHSNGISNLSLWLVNDGKQTRICNGISVDRSGLISDHNFLENLDETSPNFSSGINTIEIFVRILGKGKDSLLKVIPFYLSEETVAKLNSPNEVGIFLTWNPVSNQYDTSLKSSTNDPRYKSMKYVQ